jgi:hypothetical protein
MQAPKCQLKVQGLKPGNCLLEADGKRPPSCRVTLPQEGNRVFRMILFLFTNPLFRAIDSSGTKI